MEKQAISQPFVGVYGTQLVYGLKVIANQMWFQNTPNNVVVKSVEIDNNATPASNLRSGIAFIDKNGASIGWVGVSKDTSGNQQYEIQTQGNTNSLIAGQGIKSSVLHWSMPDYSSGVSESVTGFTAPSDGWLSLMTGTVSNGSPSLVTVNGNYLQYSHVAGSASIQVTDIIPIRKGDVITGTNIQTFWFYKCIGA